MASNAPIKWQLDCSEVKQRNSWLLSSGIWADCSFEVGLGRVHRALHKLVLAAGSPVFEDMLYSEERPGTIQVSDVELDVFDAILSYIYTDEVHINSCQYAQAVYQGAHKYALPHLQAACVSYLTSNLDPDNVCSSYEFAELVNERELLDVCLQMMRDRTSEVLEAPSLVEAQETTVARLFALEPLRVGSELQLFAAAERRARAWATGGPQDEDTEDSQVRASGEPTTWFGASSPQVTSARSDHLKDDERTVQPPLRSAVEHIRFLTLTPVEFANYPSLKTLLSETEIMAILMNLTIADSHEPMPRGLSTSRTSRISKLDIKSSNSGMKVSEENLKTEAKGRVVVDLKDIPNWPEEFKSSPIFVNNIPWRIHLMRYKDSKDVSITILCDWKCDPWLSHSWSCYAEGEMIILPHELSSECQSLRIKFNQEFSNDKYSDRFQHFIVEDAMNPAKGFVLANNLTIELHIKIISAQETRIGHPKRSLHF